MNNSNPSPTKGSKMFHDVAIAVAISLAIATSYHFISSINKEDNKTLSQLEITEENVNSNSTKFSFSTNSYFFEESLIKNNQFLGDILYKNGIAYPLIAELEQKAKKIYDVRKIRAGKNYTLVKEDSCSTMVALVYQPDPLRYVVYDFRDSVNVKMVDKEFVTCIESTSGKITTSLWDAVVGQGKDYVLVDLMEDALESSVSFYHTQVGDEFKVIYERNYIDDKPVTIGKVLGAYYKNERGEHYSLYFESDKYQGYFDEEGRPSKQSFLMSPVKSSRISSRFSYSRFHPIKKRRIPHLGTDYAAPHGTPIRAVADGVVIAASYTRGNGKFVKLKHDRTYQTQYLHMSRYAKGVVPGATVNRGETIGYVGSTGLATGPHVCFRFWKNGRQVDHRRENFPPADPMSKEYLPSFYVKRDEVMQFLDQIPVIENEGRAISTSLENPNT